MLIADSGSSITDWTVLKNGVKVLDFQSQGLNPYVHSLFEIEEVLSEVKINLKGKYAPEKIFFYGAGCSNASMVKKMEGGFKNSGFLNESILVSHDLLAAAHALFQKDNGIACILGTGSSSALYRKGEIVDSIPALGYVLGDEGGGLDLGKRLLLAIYKREAPESIQKAFHDKYNLNVEDLLRSIYFEKSPNRFIASFSTFISEYLEEEYLRELVLNSFRAFISLNVIKYKHANSLPVGFVGSVAFHFKVLLMEVLSEFELKAGHFMQSPMEGLITYHGSNLS